MVLQVKIFLDATALKIALFRNTETVYSFILENALCSFGSSFLLLQHLWVVHFKKFLNQRKLLKRNCGNLG